MDTIDFLIVGWLVLVGLLVTKRVIVAWLMYFSLRRRPMFQKPSARRYLWIRTLRLADGKDTPVGFEKSLKRKKC